MSLPSAEVFWKYSIQLLRFSLFLYLLFCIWMINNQPLREPYCQCIHFAAQQPLCSTLFRCLVITGSVRTLYIKGIQKRLNKLFGEGVGGISQYVILLCWCSLNLIMLLQYHYSLSWSEKIHIWSSPVTGIKCWQLMFLKTIDMFNFVSLIPY